MAIGMDAYDQVGPDHYKCRCGTSWTTAVDASRCSHFGPLPFRSIETVKSWDGSVHRVISPTPQWFTDLTLYGDLELKTKTMKREYQAVLEYKLPTTCTATCEQQKIDALQQHQSMLAELQRTQIKADDLKRSLSNALDSLAKLRYKDASQLDTVPRRDLAEVQELLSKRGIELIQAKSETQRMGTEIIKLRAELNRRGRDPDVMVDCDVD